ncbi:MAG: glycerol kinase GlpK [Candidatus Heimdallarchaeaceae archaeon]
MKGTYVLGIDQGTTGTRAMIFNHQGEPIGWAYKKHKQFYPKPGWVEHDPQEIWKNTLAVTKEAIEKAKIGYNQICSIGITNQRETVVVWDKETDEPLYNAIVWQCRRTADYCAKLKEEGFEDLFRQKSGLVLDPYFSGSKIAWLLNNVPKIKDAAEKNQLLVGTIDSWLIWKLTGNHVTDYSNASRTLLMNIHEGKWDSELLEVFKIPEDILPEIRDSSDKETYGTTHKGLLGYEIPVAGDAGDQQAALFGQTCFDPGNVKNTYGTGNFMLMNTGNNAIASSTGLLTTVAWGINGKLTYALEGSVFITGAVIEWLEEGVSILENKGKLAEIMKNYENDGVYFVPAFTGLGTPHWDSYARGLIIGLTRGTRREHIIRAALESICYQSQDVLTAMKQDSKREITVLRVDGGVTNCNPLMQFQADISEVKVQRPKVNETTVLGASYLAGLAVGYWENLDDIRQNFQIAAEFNPRLNPDKKRELLRNWHLAVERSMGWAR